MNKFIVFFDVNQKISFMICMIKDVEENKAGEGLL